MKKLRVLVVEDSLTIRKRLCEILAGDPGIEVIAEAEDGKQAIELCQALRPDVITLDMVLPIMSGVAATEYIMAYCPTPILIVSASFNRGELFKTYDALAAGAVDVMEKPLCDDDGAWEKHFLATVKLVARVKVVTHLRGRLAPASEPRQFHGAVQHACRVVAIGASTGGPRAVANVLQSLPRDFGLPLVVVVHIGEAFGIAYADWLDGQSPHKVRQAENGQTIPDCGVFLAPPNRHLVIRRGKLYLTDDAERFSCRPSVDVLFESVALEYGSTAAACLLTGMGQDGARGLLAIRQAGGMTIAQDEASSVVYGMPREAALLNAAQRVLPLSEIGPALAALVSNGK